MSWDFHSVYFFRLFFFLFVGSSLRFGFFFCIFSFCFSSFCSYFPPCVLFMSRNRFGCEKLPSPCVVVLLILVLFATHVCVRACMCVYMGVFVCRQSSFCCFLVRWIWRKRLAFKGQLEKLATDRASAPLQFQSDDRQLDWYITLYRAVYFPAGKRNFALWATIKMLIELFQSIENI